MSNHESPFRPQRFVTKKIVSAACRIYSGADETLLASDQLAISDSAKAYIYLEDGDVVEINDDSLQLWDENNNETTRPLVSGGGFSESVDKAGYSHFRLKEIFEQPQKIRYLLQENLTST